ncbi:MAG: PEP-CTERM sorting domain-containing protein, partial [Tepidisphaeraceae bacterium]
QPFGLVNPVIVYSPNSGGVWTNQVAVNGNSPAGNVPGLTTVQKAGDFDFFDNLAITGTAVDPVLTFVAESTDAAQDEGILQWDSASSSLGDVAFTNDTKGYNLANSGTDSGGGTLEMQVNGSSQVLFPAQNSSNTSLLVRGNPSSLTTVFTSTGSLSNANLPNSLGPGARIGLGSDNSGASPLLGTGSVEGVYTIPATPGSPTLVSGSDTPSTIYQPLLGYASGNGLDNATLMVVGGSNSTQDIVLSRSNVNSGVPQSILVHPFSWPHFTSLLGQMTPNGKIAMYIPDTAGDTIQYADATVLNPQASVIASVVPSSGPVPNSAIAVDPGGTNLHIIALNPDQDWAPQINANSTVVFSAEIGTSPSDENQAMLLWQPGDVSPQIVLSSSADDTVTDDDTVVIDGVPEVIADFNLNLLANENDYYKNSLSDNYLALDVDYYLGPDTTDTANAVIITSLAVPEPATVGLLSLASLGLLVRRRHA